LPTRQKSFEQARGAPTYLIAGLSVESKTLRLKPQNLITGLRSCVDRALNDLGSLIPNLRGRRRSERRKAESPWLISCIGRSRAAGVPAAPPWTVIHAAGDLTTFYAG